MLFRSDSVGCCWVAGKLVGLPSSNQQSHSCAQATGQRKQEVAVREFALHPRARQCGQHVMVLTEDGSKVRHDTHGNVFVVYSFHPKIIVTIEFKFIL